MYVQSLTEFYFRIIAALSLEERGLFRERIRFLDKKIHPGLTKLTWASKGISDYFVTDCRINAAKIQSMVDDYKGANQEISSMCVKISELSLIKIDNRKVYENLEFDEEQVTELKRILWCPNLSRSTVILLVICVKTIWQQFRKHLLNKWIQISVWASYPSASVHLLSHVCILLVWIRNRSSKPKPLWAE